MTKTNVVLYPDMGLAIAEHLQKVAQQKLPASGFLAGQAVDSAITDLFGKGGGVYNDLDIFRMVPFEDTKLLVRKKDPDAKVSQLTQRSEATVKQTAHAYLGMVQWLELVSTYGIKSVSRQNMLNFVNCCVSSMREMSRKNRIRADSFNPMLYLNSFDINSTRVGVDLATKKLIWTPDYQDFLATRQLKTCASHTPYHTFLRLLKKQQELPDTYLNLEQEAAIALALHTNPDLNWLRSTKSIETIYGKKTQELAREFSAESHPYFEQIEKVFTARPAFNAETHKNKWIDITGSNEIKLWTLSPKGSVPSDIQKISDEQGCLALYTGPKLVRQQFVPSHSKIYYKWYNLASKLEQAVPTLIDTVGGGRAASSHLTQRLLSDAALVYKPKEQVPTRIRPFVQLNALANGFEYAQGQALDTMADYVNEWVFKHSSFASILFGFTLDEQYHCIKRVEALVRNIANNKLGGDQLKVIGLIESLLPVFGLGDFVALEKAVLVKIEEDGKPYESKPVDVEGTLTENSQFKLVELRSKLEIDAEGSIMKHCVAGYGSRISSGDCHIFKVEPVGFETVNGIDHNRSTFELRPITSRTVEGTKTVTGYKLVQNRAFRNEMPTASNQSFVDQFLKSLNTKVTERLKSAGISIASPTYSQLNAPMELRDEAVVRWDDDIPF